MQAVPVFSHLSSGHLSMLVSNVLHAGGGGGDPLHWQLPEHDDSTFFLQSSLLLYWVSWLVFMLS